MNGNGGYGRGMTPALASGASAGGWSGNYGPMHDAMFDALATGLGLTRSELDSRVAAGETPAQIAASKGISQTDFANIFTEARKTAMQKAVEAGYMTQQQADWMLNRTPPMAGGAGVNGRGRYGYGHRPFCGTQTTNP
ncbi:MAG: hypothetical protein HY023_18390 [Chloroflexi bacterium]|nr:hypothetical protein [Chloroflexota bacterium]